MEMIRAFIAIPLPGPLLERLAALQRKLERQIPDRSVRWVRAEGIHLTLKFLGDTPTEKLPDIEQALAAVARHVSQRDYVVTLGPVSSAEPGREPSLPTFTASVGAFTRLWLGVRPATGLAVTDELSGPQDLLSRLDGMLRLPDPKPDWDF